MKDEKLIITIDGPAGAGKSTVSKILAERLEYLYINTGAMYRVVALECKKKDIDPEDEEGLKGICSQLDIRFEKKDSKIRVFSHGEDVTELINTSDISLLASKVSAQRVVREALVKIQRQMGKNGGVVLEGRDTGTVVFPQAHLKIYLDASLEERGRRRYHELLLMNQQVELSQVIKETERRDYNDSHRDLSPLKKAEDAILIDSTKLTVEDVIDIILTIIHTRYPSLRIN